MAGSMHFVTMFAMLCTTSLGRRAQAKDKTREVIENFNMALSDDDFDQLRSKSEEMMVEQIVYKAHGDLSERQARELVRTGLKSMTDDDAEKIIRSAEETMSVNDARRFVNAEKAMLGDAGWGSEVDNDRKAGRHALVQRILSNYKDSLTAEDSKQLSKIAEDSMVSQILADTRGGLPENDARRIIHNAEMSMTEGEAERIIENAAGEMTVEDAQHLVNDLEEKTKAIEHAQAQADSQQIIENFNMALSKEDADNLQAKAEDMMVQQLVSNANGDLSEAQAREVVHKGLASMTDKDAEQIISNAEDTMSADEAQRFVNVEKGVLDDIDTKKKAAARAEAQGKTRQIIEGFNMALSKEDTDNLQAKAEEMMVQQIVNNANGDLSEAQAREVVHKGLASMTDKDAEQIISNAEDTMSADEAQRIVNVEKGVLDDIDTKKKAAERAAAEGKTRQIIESFNMALSKEDTDNLQAKAEKMMVQQIVNNANGDLSEAQARVVVHNGLASMTDKDAEQIISNAEDTMSADEAQRFVNVEKGVLDDIDTKKKAAERAEVQGKTRQIIESFNLALSKEDTDNLQAKAEDMMVQQLVNNANGALSEAQAREVVHKGLASMTDKDAEQIISNAEDTMSADEVQRFVNVEKGVLDDIDTKKKAAERAVAQGKSRQIIENFNMALSKENADVLLANAEDMMVQQIVTDTNGDLSEARAREVVHKGLASMTDKDAEQIISKAEETMSVDDARRFVNVEKSVLVDSDMKTSSQLGSIEVARRSVQKVNDHEEKTNAAEHTQSQDEARQIIENFDKSLSKEDADDLRAKAEETFTHEIIQNSGGSVSESEARDIVRKGEDAMTDEDAKRIIDRAEETMSVDDIRQVVNVAEEAVLDARMGKAAKTANKRRASKKQNENAMDKFRRVVNVAEEAALDARMKQASIIASKAKALEKKPETAKAGSVKSSPSQMVRNVEKSMMEEAKMVRNAGKNMMDEAKQMFNSAKRALHMDGVRKQGHDNDPSELHAISEHKASASSPSKPTFQIGEHVQFRDSSDEEWKDGVVTSTQPLLVRFKILTDHKGFEYNEVRKFPEAHHHTEDSATHVSPSQIINRASNMMSVADFKMSKATSPGLMGLASPFGVA